MPTVNLRLPQIAFVSLAAFAPLACGGAFRPMTLPAPISMSPMSDATLSVELGHVFVTGDVLKSGMGEESALAVDLGITNNGREPFTLSAGSMSCWMELSPTSRARRGRSRPRAAAKATFKARISTT